MLFNLRVIECYGKQCANTVILSDICRNGITQICGSVYAVTLFKGINIAIIIYRSACGIGQLINICNFKCYKFISCIINILREICVRNNRINLFNFQKVAKKCFAVVFVCCSENARIIAYGIHHFNLKSIVNKLCNQSSCGIHADSACCSLCNLGFTCRADISVGIRCCISMSLQRMAYGTHNHFHYLFICNRCIGTEFSRGITVYYSVFCGNIHIARCPMVFIDIAEFCVASRYIFVQVQNSHDHSRRFCSRYCTFRTEFSVSVTLDNTYSAEQIDSFRILIVNIHINICCRRSRECAERKQNAHSQE